MLIYHACHARACSPVTVSSAEHTLLNDPLPSSCSSLYRSPTCRKASASLGLMVLFRHAKPAWLPSKSRLYVWLTSANGPSQPTRHRPQSRPQACSCSALCWQLMLVLHELEGLLQPQPALSWEHLKLCMLRSRSVPRCVGLSGALDPVP